MLAFIHRAGLTDDDAGAWLRYVLRALARLGHTVHAVCGEDRPERFDFIAEAYAYEPDGTVATRLHRETVHPGRIILHAPVARGGAPLTVDALFDALAGVVPGHGVGVLAALGADAAGAAAHRAQAAWGTPYTVFQGAPEEGDPAIRDGAFCVFDRSGAAGGRRAELAIPRGVDATAVHPLRRQARAKRIERLCERLRASDLDERATQALQSIEAIDWTRDRVVVSGLLEPTQVDTLARAVADLAEAEPDPPVVLAGALPASLYPEWLPCTDVFVTFEDPGAARPGVLDAMAAGVVPVCTAAAGAGAVTAALTESGHERAARTLALPPAPQVRRPALSDAIRLALAEADALKPALRQATVQRHDWHVVAAGLVATLEEVIDLGRSARVAG